MPTTRSFLYRVGQWFKSKPPAPGNSGPAQNPPILVAAVRRDNRWALVPDGYREDGVRIYQVMLGERTVAQYYAVQTEYENIQSAIDGAPKEYKQPRRAKLEVLDEAPPGTPESIRQMVKRVEREEADHV